MIDNLNFLMVAICLNDEVELMRKLSEPVLCNIFLDIYGLDCFELLAPTGV